jgi:SAM-dependent methyltransferase
MDAIREKKDYKRFTGPYSYYDLIGKVIFSILQKRGLKTTSRVLDIGCGSLGVGRVFIPYLRKDRYFGIEPEEWLIDEALEKEIGEKLIEKKNPKFDNNSDFDLKVFDKEYNFVFANSIFIHADREQVKKCISETANILKKNGKFLFNFVIGKNDSELEGWTYPSLVKYTRNFIEYTLYQNNFDFKYLKLNWQPDHTFVIAWQKEKNVLDSTT